jgi:hypothetical protein
MTLVEKIMTIYPELTHQDFDYFSFKDKGTILVQDNSDGNGPFIAKWEHPTLAKPTNEQLQGA